MVCLLRLCLLLGVLAAGSMQHHSPSKQDKAGRLLLVASATTTSSSVPADSSTFPGHAHTHGNEQIGGQKSSNFAGFNNTDDFQRNFSWDALARPPGSASESALFEDRVEQHSVKSGKKRPHSDRDDKETVSPSPKCYECRFCTMKFHKSQALGGHMNRHKQERQNESWNKACQLLQQGSPSLLLPGDEQSFLSCSKFTSSHMQRSEFDAPGVASCLDSMMPLRLPCAPLSSMPMPFVMQPTSSSTPLPFGSDRASFDLFTSSGLHMNQTIPVQPSSTESFLDANAHVLAPRELSPQNFTQRYTHMPLLSHSQLSQQEFTTLGVSQAEGAHHVSHYGAQDARPIYSYPTETIREFTAHSGVEHDTASSPPEPRLQFMFTGSQGSQNAQNNQLLGRSLTGRIGPLSNPHNLYFQSCPVLTVPQDGNGARLIDLEPQQPRMSEFAFPQDGNDARPMDPAPRQARTMSSPVARRRRDAFSAMQSTASSSAEGEGGGEENNPN